MTIFRPLTGLLTSTVMFVVSVLTYCWAKTLRAATANAAGVLSDPVYARLNCPASSSWMAAALAGIASSGSGAVVGRFLMVDSRTS